MGLRTALTEIFGIDHPIVLAPMGGVAGGALAAGVSEGGGLGLVGAGRGDLEWLDRDYLPIWAGEAVDLVNELGSASALVASIAEQAERTITVTGNTVRTGGVRH
jgi:hypothetical protein